MSADHEERDPWTWLTSRPVYDNPWITLTAHEVLTPAGQPGIYAIVHMKKQAVGVLPIEDDGTVHLVGQWRPPLGAYSWEMPEGGAEPGEDLEDCARRELEEEAGVVAGRLEKIAVMHLSNSTTDETAHLYLATALRPGQTAPDDTEVLKHRRAHFLDVLAEIVDGRISDAMTVAAVLRAHHMAVTGALPAGLARAMLAKPAAGPKD